MKRLSSSFSVVRAVVLGVAVSTIAVACSSGDSSPSSSAPTEASAPIEESTGVPERIVSLSPTHTEIIFEIGGAEQVVAVDAMSNHPPEAAAVLTALSGFEPNVESIVSYEPDLVVIGDDYNGLAEQLASVGIESWTSPAPQSLDEVLEQIEDLGDRIGRSEAAAELTASMRADIESIVESSPALSEPLTYYHELDDSYFSITSNTFIGSVYALFGLRNIADAAEANSDYPQLSAEFIISQNPDLVFLADTKCCAVTAESVSSRPGWDSLNAVQNQRVIALDDDVASRWGPRIVDFIRAISVAVADLVAQVS
jgi:iron complex transport system substrate-binding protein